MSENEPLALQKAHISGEQVTTAAAKINNPRSFASIELDALGISLAFSSHLLHPEVSHIARASATPEEIPAKLLCVRPDKPLDVPTRKDAFFVGIRIGKGPEYFIAETPQLGRLVLDDKKQLMPSNELLLDEIEAEREGLEVSIYKGDVSLWIHNITIRHGVTSGRTRHNTHK